MNSGPSTLSPPKPTSAVYATRTRSHSSAKSIKSSRIDVCSFPTSFTIRADGISSTSISATPRKIAGITGSEGHIFTSLMIFSRDTTRRSFGTYLGEPMLLLAGSFTYHLSALGMASVRPNHTMEPTPPALLMTSFAVPPSSCGQPRSRRPGSSCSR
jgi:hypothetical protein